MTEKTNTIADMLFAVSEEKWKDLFGALASEHFALPEDNLIRESMRKAFSLSEFISNVCIRSPKILIDLIQSGELAKPYKPGMYHDMLKRGLSECTDASGLGQALVSIRRPVMVCIAWRDLCGWADLAETLDALSEFAEACVDNALEKLQNWQCRQMGTPLGKSGSPQGLVVIAMGKLGGHELNFSSDIDLVFAYPENGKTAGTDKSVDNDTFFLSLARRLIQVLGFSGVGENLFRVDMRLRPYGENGPLVMSFDAMESYYEAQGRDWERYAWLRARAIAGDKGDGQKLLKRLSPFIYRRYLDFTVFDALREMKQQIAREVKRRDMADNLKLGPGGIREIEFFCQVFQILRGGVSPNFRERRTRKMLSVLQGEGVISRQIYDDLAAAYDFLRTTENHLQEFSDLQTHDIPADDLGRRRIAFSMGFSSFAAFAERLAMHRKKVHRYFYELLETEEEPKESNLLDVLWQHASDMENAGKILRECGFSDPEKILSTLAYLKDAPETRALSPSGRKRVDRLMPTLIKTVGACDQADAVLNRIVDLVKSIERRTSYIALLVENPKTLTHLVHLAEKSPWIITFLTRHPVLLDEFLDPRSLYSPPERQDLKEEIVTYMENLPNDDLEFQIETLCIFKQTNILKVAAADVSGGLPTMRVSDHLTEIAETVLGEVLNMAWAYLTARHGLPDCTIFEAACDTGFLIVGYGKLGGIELGYNSDLDLVFLHAGTGQPTRDSDNPISTPYFFSRLGQRIVHLLTAHTRAGKLWETDMRLRPSGSAGPLVSQIDAFFSYQMEEGWTWEKQALVRARPVCGDPALAKRFEDIRKKVIACKRDESRLKEDVRVMREKMRKERTHAGPEEFDLKESPGGLIDIEFMVQYLVLLESHRFPELLEWTDNIRILETLSNHGIIDREAAKTLHDAYLTFRTAIHRLSLAEKPAIGAFDDYSDTAGRVAMIWHHHLG